ncbi:hypothetical protein ACIBH1_44795 [Nonomuraea sp. NPDC050663]|uniref:hypothetical protein n=1 Tax=Nonomuraea sp. NPDC050663 TaxID=3364370 RepID=UPI0037ADD3D7
MARLILTSDGLTAHLARPARANHVQAMTDTLARIAHPANHLQDVLADLLDLTRDHGPLDNTSIAVVDLAP